MLKMTPQEAVMHQQWQCLEEAHQFIESGKISAALENYQLVIPNLQYGQTLRWNNLSREPNTPSRNRLCVLLVPYYTLTQMWSAWRYLATPVLENADFHAIPLAEQLALTAAHGWASLRRRRLSEIIKMQLYALERSHLPFSSAQHHLILCHAYTLAFDHEKALLHGREAFTIFEDTGSVWGAMRADEILGTAYYTAWDYDSAHRCYARLEQRIAAVGSEAYPFHPYYARGWVYLGQKHMDSALDCFRKGQQQKNTFGLLYDAARCIYAEGYTRFRQHDFEGSLECHEAALRIFCDDDHYILNLHNFKQGSRSTPMMAACWHNIALVHEYQKDFKQALKAERNAIKLQLQLDDPGQSSDFLRRGIYHALRRCDISLALYYLWKFIQLRIKYAVPDLLS